ncbi:lipase family protein [Variovorax sp. LjRoot84]|uniref:lipase family protein n=1 Tax=Variovorax sp. LjRoot84 TaxID=3342340 RepID=UPI003ED1373C
MPGVPYDPSRTALYSPERHETLFEPGQSYTPAQWAVEAARLAYYRAETSEAERLRLTEALRHAGFGAPKLIAHAETHGFAFAALHADGSALLAFRGTQPDEIRDHATNLQAHQVDWAEAGGRVHAGFARSARALWPAVREWAEGEAAGRSALIMTGHSLGGALAMLIATLLPPTLLVTLGSPRVGNTEFVAALAGIEIVRLVDGCDLVTQLPPAFSLYAHAGATSYITCAGECLHNPDASFIEADRTQGRTRYVIDHAWRRGAVLLRDLADHAPINYARAFFA